MDNPSEDLTLEDVSVDLDLPTGTDLSDLSGPTRRMGPASRRAGRRNASRQHSSSTTRPLGTRPSRPPRPARSTEKNSPARARPPRSRHLTARSHRSCHARHGAPPLRRLSVGLASTCRAASTTTTSSSRSMTARFVPFLPGTTLTSTSVTAGEGDRVRLRIRATDGFGHVSDPTEVSTTIDAVPPVATIGAADLTRKAFAACRSTSRTSAHP